VIDVNLVVSAPMAATLGFAYGMGPCLISCAPFLAPVFLASHGSVKTSWKIILPLSLGRLTAYGSFGFVVGMMGAYIKGSIQNDAVHTIVGSAALMMGVALLLRKSKKSCASFVVNHQLTDASDKGMRVQLLLSGGLFLMGIGMTLSTCAPLSIVLFSAAMSGSAAGGLILGASFGLGAIAIPAVVYGIGLAYLSANLREQLQSWSPKIEKLSAWMLVVVGVSNLVRW
jgi:thiol:disulfide interchange protein DsbD